MTTGGRLVKHALYYLVAAGGKPFDETFNCQHAGADRWTVHSVGIAKAVTPKETIPISPRNGEVSEKAGSGSQGDGFLGPGKAWLGAGGTLWEKNHARRVKKLIPV